MRIIYVQFYVQLNINATAIEYPALQQHADIGMEIYIKTRITHLNTEMGIIYVQFTYKTEY